MIMVMRTSLSMKEFASALGMKESDVFVKKMFAIVDKDNDNRISFQEFLDMIVLFSKGRTDDKLQVSSLLLSMVNISSSTILPFHWSKF